MIPTPDSPQHGRIKALGRLTSCALFSSIHSMHVSTAINITPHVRQGFTAVGTLLTFVTLLITLPLKSPSVALTCRSWGLAEEPWGTWEEAHATSQLLSAHLGSNAWLLHNLFRNNFEKKPVREMQNKKYFNTSPEVFI